MRPTPRCWRPMVTLMVGGVGGDGMILDQLCARRVRTEMAPHERGHP